MTKQADIIRSKLLIQAKRVLRKLKPSKSQRELSNQEIEIALYQYSTSNGLPNEYGENMMEFLHDKLCKLTEEQMAIIKKRYWEAKSFAVIGNEMGHLHDHKWAYRKIEDILDILRT